MAQLMSSVSSRWIKLASLLSSRSATLHGWMKVGRESLSRSEARSSRGKVLKSVLPTAIRYMGGIHTCIDWILAATSDCSREESALVVYGVLRFLKDAHIDKNRIKQSGYFNQWRCWKLRQALVEMPMSLGGTSRSADLKGLLCDL